MNNASTIEKPESAVAEPVAKSRSEKPKPANKPRGKAKSVGSVDPKPKKSGFGIPAGRPFRTKDQVAKERAPRQKPERVHPKPAKDAKADRSDTDKSKAESGVKPATASKASSKSQEATDETKSLSSLAELPPKQQLDILVEAAEADKPGAVDAIRIFLEKNPSFYRHYGDTARAARFAFATLASEDSLLGREAIFKHSEDLLERYLPGDEHCPTERILAEQIVVSYQRANYFDYESSNFATSTNAKLVGLLLKKQEQSQNQLYKSINKLETFRRLKAKPK